MDSTGLQAVLVDDVSQGSLSLNADGSFTYTPNLDYSGSDSFTDVASDGVLNSAVATVSIVISVPPVVVVDDAYDVTEDVLLVVPALTGVLANDSDTNLPEDLTVSLVTGPSHGSLTVLGSDGGFSYVPAADYFGGDSFVYRATDGVNGTSAEAVVTLTVLAVNDAPVAVDDSYQTQVDTPLSVGAATGVLANDTDADGDSVQGAVVVNDVGHGSLVLNGDGGFDYSPDAGYSGPESFTYRADDGSNDSNLATMTLSIGNAAGVPPRILTGQISFNKQNIDATVVETHYSAGADLDGELDIDLVATDYRGESVYWYQNDGVGNFQKIIIDNSLNGAYPGHLGDVDSDGDIDILAGGYDGDTIAWYINDGAGNFTKQIIDAAADGIHSIVTVDLDDDRDVDLLTSMQDAGTVVWCENDGSNAFIFHLIDSAALGAKRADFADIDADGDLDVVSVSDASSEVAWYENDGSESFTKKVIASDARGAYFHCSRRSEWR